MPLVTAHRGALFHFTEAARLGSASTAHEYVQDGLLILEGGRVLAAGPARALLDRLPEGVVPMEHSGKLLMPGFIDAHCHAPQTAAVAAYGERLLEWLKDYVFPEEARFADPGHARRGYSFFLDQLLRCGTTTAVAYATSHPQATAILFQEAEARSLRFVAGKTMMDRGAPENILDTASSSYEDARRLIQAWHGRGRLSYAITPRFAPSSTPEQLAAAGRLRREYPDMHLQTHLSENEEEVRLVRSLYPEARDYLDVYDRYGLLGPKSLFGHCIHLTDREWARLAETGSVACWCPTSNFFLGSGVFDLDRARREGVTVALATDVGAGTSFSMLDTLSEAYKAAALRGASLSPFDGFYLATLGNARALGLDRHIGTFAPGKEADFVVLDPAATPLLRHRLGGAASLQDTLFALMILGGASCVAKTFVAGREMDVQ